MFTFYCPTCEAKLTAKNEKLFGKIVPCPKCGGMVLAQPPDDAPTPVVDMSSKMFRQKRFPDVLTHETASGIIGHTSGENLRAEVFLTAAPTAPDVSETEVHTRKVLVGILVGLSILLLVALGFLMVFQGPNRSQQQPEPLIPAPPAPPQVEQPIDPQPPDELIEKIDLVPPPVEPPEGSQQDIPVEPESFQEVPVQMADETLSAIDQRMPGFVDISVPNIDIDAKLALPIGELNLAQSSLIEFIRVISQMTGVPMTLAIDEMRPRSLSAQIPVRGQFREATVGEILTKTLAALGLQWGVADRQILIFPTDTTDKADLTFDVSDFAERTDDLTPEVLAGMVQKLVCPEVNVAVLPNHQLTLAQDERKPNGKSRTRQRDEILRFLEQLRAVRQLPQKTEWTGETLAPEAFGWDQVIKPITLNHYQAVPLSRIIAQMEEATELTIIVDHQSLHRALSSFASIQAIVQCDRGTVHDVLELSFASVDWVDLTYRIVDHHTLEVTTTESARQPDKMVMEIHRYELRGDEMPEDIVRSLRSAVAPESWVVPAQSEPQYGGDIVIDRPANCLLVRQSQPVQRQIRLFLDVSEQFEFGE